MERFEIQLEEKQAAAVKLLAAGQSRRSAEYLQWVVIGHLQDSMAVEPFTDAEIHGLSPRRRQVAEAVARGLPNKQIAEELSGLGTKVTVATTKVHLAHTLKKLGVANRAVLATRFNLWLAARSADEAKNQGGI